jgi:hypothetical protein
MTKKIEPFKIIGRNGHSCTLTKLKPKKYLLSFVHASVRWGYKEDSTEIDFVDPSGGPFISVGTSLRDLHPKLPDKEIVSITVDNDIKVTIIDI